MLATTGDAFSLAGGGVRGGPLVKLCGVVTYGDEGMVMAVRRPRLAHK